MRQTLYWLLLLGSLILYVASRALAADPAAAGMGTDTPQQSALSISKRAYPDPVIAGQSLVYEITVHNGGPGPIDNLVVSDTLPAGTSFIFYGTFCRPPVAGVASCPIASIPAGGEERVLLCVRVTGTGLTEVVNDQYAAAAPGQPPVTGIPVVVPVIPSTPYPGPTSPPPVPAPTAPPDEPTSTPTGSPQIAIAQETTGGPAAPGQTVGLRVLLTNRGTGAARDLVLALQVPAGLQARDVAVSPAAATEWTGNVLWVAWGSLEAGATAAVDLQVLVLPGASGSSAWAASVPSLGLEAHGTVEIQPQVLPSTGPAPTPWWGWLGLAGSFLAAGFLLRGYLATGNRCRPSRRG